MPGDEESARAGREAPRSVEEAAVGRGDRAAALADGVVVVACDEAEVRGPADLEPFDEPCGVELLEDPIHGHLSEPRRLRAGARPDLLTWRHVRTACDGLQDGHALRRHTQPTPPQRLHAVGVRLIDAPSA
jgi:hypothetical protein